MSKLDHLRKFKDLAPEAFTAFRAFDRAAMAEGAISVKNKELIALAVALTTQCAYCIEVHRRKAVEAGASEQEMAETVLVTAALRAGGAVAHAGHVLAS